MYTLLIDFEKKENGLKKFVFQLTGYPKNPGEIICAKQKKLLILYSILTFLASTTHSVLP